MAFGLGFIMGPFIGARLSDPSVVPWFSPAVPFYFTAILSFINAFLVFKVLPETLKIKSAKRLNISRPFHNIIKAFSNDGLRNVMPSTFLFNAGFTFFTTFFAVVLADKYRFSEASIGDYFAYVGIMIVLAQGLVVRRLSGKVADYSILRFSMLGTAVCLFWFYMIPAGSASWLYVVPPILAISNALTMSFNAALITRVTPINMRGEAMGINSSVMAIAQAIPAILAGYAANHKDTMPIVIGGFIVLTAHIAFWCFFKPKKYTQLH